MDNTYKSMILNDYAEKFGHYPPDIEAVSYYDDSYMNLICKALYTGEEITEQELKEMLSDGYDVVQSKTFSNFGKK